MGRSRIRGKLSDESSQAAVVFRVPTAARVLILVCALLVRSPYRDREHGDLLELALPNKEIIGIWNCNSRALCSEDASRNNRRVKMSG
jgi:hypothetical protein